MSEPCSHCNGTGFEMNHREIGRERRHARKLAGRSLRDVAARMGLTAAYICDLELGRRNWNANLIQRHEEATRE